MRIAFIRHGPTHWNAQHRIQGHTDIPLSEAGGELVRTWQLPRWLHGWRWFVSPLQRARQTAELLGCEAVRIEPRLTEMHWGDWEGEVAAELRARLGDAVQANEARGLDFQPPGGESPRAVQARVLEWCADLAPNSGDAIAVTHKGVIRAVYAAATGWDMCTPPAHKLSWHSAHVFDVQPCGRVNIGLLNVALDRTAAAPQTSRRC